jgi:negative regulator of flagellin synthesis FlgM
MKIDLNSSTPEPIATPQSNQTSAASTNQVQTNQLQTEQVPNGAEDRTTLAFDHANISALVSQAVASPEVRQDKVDALRQAISSGEYKVDPGKVADAMLPEPPDA